MRISYINGGLLLAYSESAEKIALLAVITIYVFLINIFFLGNGRIFKKHNGRYIGGVDRYRDYLVHNSRIALLYCRQTY